MSKRTIAGLIVMVAVFAFVWYAQALEVMKPYPADYDMIARMAKAMRHDNAQTVTLAIYAKEWTNEKAVKLMNEAKNVERTFKRLGISKSRINILIADDSGFVGNEAIDPDVLFPSSGIPRPPADGVYLILD